MEAEMTAPVNGRLNTDESLDKMINLENEIAELENEILSEDTRKNWTSFPTKRAAQRFIREMGDSTDRYLIIPVEGGYEIQLASIQDDDGSFIHEGY